MQNAVARREGQEIAAQEPVSETVAWLQFFDRAVRDPAVDVDKIERLYAMRERVMADQAKRAFLAALAAVQPKLPIIERHGKITIRDKNNEQIIKQSTPYALWEDINEAITPILSEHGMSLGFRPGKTTEGKVTVTAILGHADGHERETTVELTHDSTGSKNAVQATGSSYSYGKRYSATLALNITTRGEDDDGRTADTNGHISEEQFQVINAALDEVDADKAKFCQFMGVESLNEIAAADYPKAMKALEQKRRARGRK
jgi:hypothetical protein